MDIKFRTVIEVLGKPKEHVEKSIRNYIENIKKSEFYQIVQEEFAEIQQQEDEDMWATFAEIEVQTDKIENLTSFCFEFMPAVIDIIEPKNFSLTDADFSQFLNDLQLKLHQVDMVAKHTKMENDILKKNTSSLMKNYLVVLLRKGELTADQLSSLTGVSKELLGDFLDNLIDKGVVDLDGEVYSLKEAVKNGAE